MKKVVAVILALVTMMLFASCDLKEITAQNLADKIIKGMIIDDPETLEMYEELSEATAPSGKDSIKNKTNEVINPSRLISREDAARILGFSASGGGDDLLDAAGDSGYLRCEYIFDEWTLTFGIIQDALIEEEALKFGKDTYFLFNLNSKIRIKDKITPSTEGLGEEAYFTGSLTGGDYGPWSLDVYVYGYWIKVYIRTRNPEKMFAANGPEESEWEIEKLTAIYELAFTRLNTILN